MYGKVVSLVLEMQIQVLACTLTNIYPGIHIYVVMHQLQILNALLKMVTMQWI